jgi:hypothetical protein
MLTLGRFFPDLVRRLLQRLLITDRRRAPFRFTRNLAWTGGKVSVVDEIAGDRWSSVTAVGLGAAQTSIYAVMSRVFHSSQLAPWRDLSEALGSARKEGRLRLDRKL